jgi:multiple sugar transport system ATP-binding protein
MLDFASCLERLPEEISGGQRQRAALGRAIVRRPRLFLLDEPLASLDPQTRAQMRTELASLAARLGTTMIYVTHDQVEAMVLGHRIAVMSEGSIQQVGDPMTIYRKPANVFVARFIGSPAMNLFSGTIKKNGAGFVFHEAQTGTAAPQVVLPLPDEASASLATREGQPILLGLRPEDISADASRSDTQSAGRQVTVQAGVQAVEFAGADAYLRLRSTGGAHSFVIRARPDSNPSVGETISVAADLSRAHFFDPSTGSRIS